MAFIRPTNSFARDGEVIKLNVISGKFQFEEVFAGCASLIQPTAYGGEWIIVGQISVSASAGKCCKRLLTVVAIPPEILLCIFEAMIQIYIIPSGSYFIKFQNKIL